MNHWALSHSLGILRVAWALVLASAVHAVESTISFNLNGNSSNNNQLIEGESAGVRPAASWNGLQDFDSFLNVVRDSAGARVGGRRVESAAVFVTALSGGSSSVTITPRT
jgi:hypothetical protein